MKDPFHPVFSLRIARIDVEKIGPCTTSYLLIYFARSNCLLRTNLSLGVRSKLMLTCEVVEQLLKNNRAAHEIRSVALLPCSCLGRLCLNVTTVVQWRLFLLEALLRGGK